MKKFFLIAFVAFCVFTLFSYLLKVNKDLREDLGISRSNEKAFLYSNDSLINSNRVFKYTIEQLGYYNDSIINKLNKVKDSLDIKDKELINLQYLVSKGNRKDSILIRDTIFRDPSFSLDTLIGDRWFNVRLGLEFPNIVKLSPEYTSELYIVTNYKKETVDPPKKFFFLRWLQKKHKIVEVNIVEKNPYTKIQQQRFIEIIE